MKLSTKIIHSGLGGDKKPTGSVITPIFQTSTYVQKSLVKILDMNTLEAQTQLERH